VADGPVVQSPEVQGPVLDGPVAGGSVEDQARSRLGPAEADAFLARLETLSFDITGPLGLL
jgi:hypothetical protein